MSEYQYYEFQAIDRPLTNRELSTLRNYSSRATLTSTRFVNRYSYGSFKGSTSEWMDKYFDAFLYLANCRRDAIFTSSQTQRSVSLRVTASKGAAQVDSSSR